MNQFNANETFFGDLLSEWIEFVHTTISTEYDLSDFCISPHDFGYESYAATIRAILSNCSTADILNSISGRLDIDKFINLAHNAWSDNYIQWKSREYTKAGKDYTQTFNTFDRNDKSTTAACHLSDHDLSMYSDLIQTIIGRLQKKILEAGMAQLNI